MNQIADILDLAKQAMQENIDAVLATVVRTEGSAYRQAGAMMLICADGRSVGMISGGCLEPHIIKRAFWLTRKGANVQVYQTGDDIGYDDGEDDDNNSSDFFGNEEVRAGARENEFLEGELNFGLGCNGRVHVLFERLETAMLMLDMIQHVRNTQRPVTMATLIRFDGAKNKDGFGNKEKERQQIGSRVYLDASMSVDADTFIDHKLFKVVEKLSKHQFDKKNAEYVVISETLDTDITDDSQANKGQESLPITPINGQTEWLFQRICPQIRLLICGAGNDVMPLVTMAKLQDWHVTVIDSRPQYVTGQRFPQADVVKWVALEDHKTLIELGRHAAIAVMSHSLTQDRARLDVLLSHYNQCHYKYIGQLGPKYRTERLIKEIHSAHSNPNVLAQGMSKLHYPIGYPLGGDGPEALALSIMAQVSAMVHNQARRETL